MSKFKVQWATEARDQWRKTALYIYREWGVSAMRKFKVKTEDTIDKIESFPAIGSVEPLLADRSISYRSLVITEQNKLIYYVKDETIYIVDFWDTRREPKKQANTLK